jgi:2-polyprenyl-3-methyl-5-hydroxy-6-metoxy-1,4-benzoquinol methylase
MYVEKRILHRTVSKEPYMNFNFVRQIRERELHEVFANLPLRGATARLLELGAGSGWQSKMLSDAGWDVTALDVQESMYLKNTVYPVEVYDGRKIPFHDGEFEVVFSSNVLEHVEHIELLLDEVSRVLKPGGVALHILPTAAWRGYTSIAHYPAVLKVLLRLISQKFTLTPRLLGSSLQDGEAVPDMSADWRTLLKKALHSGRHGEIGSEFSELYYFSRFRWYAAFRKAGFTGIQRKSMGLTYTGYSLFGPALSFRLRRGLAHFIGASCHMFVMQQSSKD